MGTFAAAGSGCGPGRRRCESRRQPRGAAGGCNCGVVSSGGGAGGGGRGGVVGRRHASRGEERVKRPSWAPVPTSPSPFNFRSRTGACTRSTALAPNSSPLCLTDSPAPRPSLHRCRRRLRRHRSGAEGRAGRNPEAPPGGPQRVPHGFPSGEGRAPVHGRTRTGRGHVTRGCSSSLLPASAPACRCADAGAQASRRPGGSRIVHKALPFHRATKSQRFLTAAFLSPNTRRYGDSS